MTTTPTTSSLLPTQHPGHPRATRNAAGIPEPQSQLVSTGIEQPRASAMALTDLLLEVQAGDRDAFERLYDQSSLAAFSLAVRIIRDRRLAADAVQEAFIQIWKNAHAFDPTKGTGQTWILMITHRKSVDLIRRERFHRPCPYDHQDTEPTSPDTPPEHLTRQTETRKQLREILAELTPIQRQVIELAYFGGYTQSELATKLSLPLGTIKSRTHTALSALRHAAEQAGVSIQDAV